MISKNRFCLHNHSLKMLTKKGILNESLQSSQCNASVQSLLLAGNFLYNQEQPSAGERGGKLSRKNTIFNEHPV